MTRIRRGQFNQPSLSALHPESGDLPSVVANSGTGMVSFLTITLPARSVAIHPALPTRCMSRTQSNERQVGQVHRRWYTPSPPVWQLPVTRAGLNASSERTPQCRSWDCGEQGAGRTV